MTDSPLTSQLRHVTRPAVDSPAALVDTLNTVIDAVNQLLPGRGTLVVDDQGRVMRRPVSVERLDAMVGSAEHADRDEAQA